MRLLILAVALWTMTWAHATAAEAPAQRGIYALAEGHARVEPHLRLRRSGALTTLDLSQSTPDGARLVTGYTLELTKLMHLVIVRDDFRGFMHVHPALRDGHFSIALPLAPDHAYYAYADTTPAGLTKQVFRFTIGTPYVPTPSFHAADAASLDGYDVKLSTSRVEPGTPVDIEATITRAGNVVTDLHPYLGAAAHAVLVDTRTLAYIHVHPMPLTGSNAMAEMEKNGDHHEIDLPANATFAGHMKLMLPALAPGTYRMWLQFQTRDGLKVVPFTLAVAARPIAAVILGKTGSALTLAAGMLWQVGWSLILGFLLSGLVQAVVSKDGMRAQLGRNGVREIALATFYGAVSSSCSYAASAMSKTLFKKGAGFIPSLAFLFSSTNLVVELGLILLFLMGWQFAAAEWIGGVVLIVIMAILVKLTYPAKLIAQARQHVDGAHGHEHGDDTVDGASLWEKLRNPQTHVFAAQNAAMDFSMLWKDLIIGFLIAGALAAFIPDGAWKGLFLAGAPHWLQVPLNAVIGALIAVVTFVCSIGNVPMAAVLWGSGISFAGVLSFLYADLIVLPLLDIYRKYYGWKMAAYIGAVFFVTMVTAGIVMNALFGIFHAIPARAMTMTMSDPAALFQLNYTFWLNLIFGALGLYVWYLKTKNPMGDSCHAPKKASCCS